MDVRIGTGPTPPEPIRPESASSEPASFEPASPEGLFDRLLAADPSAPFLTFYDDSTGERAELSAKSLGNWVAKTHFLLVDSLGLGVGDQAVIRLPVHWLAAPILLGCWFAGLEVLSSPSHAVAVAFADTRSLATGPTDGLPQPLADEVFAVSMLSMARPDVAPPGAEDFSTSVRPMPDAWQSVQGRAVPADPGLDGASRAELVAAGAAAAATLGLEPGGRLLWTGNWAGPADWISALLAPLAVGGSVVLVRNPNPDKYLSRIAAERVTARH
jgi:uncharacterized protein (TIGR03089 family)